MVTIILAAISFALLFIPIDLSVALTDFNSLKFIFTMFSHLFGHAGFDHFLYNFLAFLPVGLYVEHKIGWKKMLQIYFGAGVIGALAQFNFSSAMGLIGASGAISGVKAAACYLYPKKTDLEFLVMWGLFLGFVGSQLLDAFSPFGGNIAYFSHIGGALAGAAIARYQSKTSPLDS